MRRKQVRKLSLAKETVRSLAAAKLSGAAGGCSVQTLYISCKGNGCTTVDGLTCGLACSDPC
jgi:hypothetical protein